MKICPICKSEYGSGEVFCPVDGARLSSPSQMVRDLDPDDPLVGTMLADRYKILRQIGEGGMGIVYEALHIIIEKKVALKVLRDDFSKRPEVVERFRQEARSASRIGHEHIVDISDFGETPSGQSYFVMEYLEGEDVANVLAREGTVAPVRAVDIVLQCARALGSAHSKGIVHRDMKPENIFLVNREDRQDFVKIVDFGIAKMSDLETDGPPGRKLTKTGMIFGTPEYMSPEQAAGKPLDHRVDIYALGVILFEAITGRVPFVGDTFMGILTQHMFEDIPTLRQVNPNVRCPDELESVIRAALAKDPEERFHTMDEFGRALSNAMDVSGLFPMHDTTSPGYGEPVRVRGSGAPIIHSEPASAEFGVRPKRRGLLIAAAAVAVLSIGVGAFLALRPGTSAANGGDEFVAIAGPPAGDPAAGSDPGEDGENEEEPEPEEASGVVLTELDASAAETEETEELVQITVDTRPAGADIEVDGRGVVCEPSPCSFETPVGEGIRIRAVRGPFAAVRDLVPSQAMAIEMTMSRPPRGDRVRTTPDTMSMSGRMRNTDLKFPDIFR